jgi:hypothetical protein
LRSTEQSQNGTARSQNGDPGNSEKHDKKLPSHCIALATPAILPKYLPSLRSIQPDWMR